MKAIVFFISCIFVITHGFMSTNLMNNYVTKIYRGTALQSLNVSDIIIIIR